ncbi:MAG: hypothetical protein DRO88_06640 [Promethearchaeia archaeon]|nr:MAG: hypothetical protein DRO88_06640 [Candidatus Lokiarchaeia archaeon]
MSQLEEFLELQDRVSKLEALLKKKEQDISEKDEKILHLSEKINHLTNEAVKAASDTRHFRSMMSVLETDKNNLERERARLIKEVDALNTQLKQFAHMIETSNQTIQAKEEMLLSKEKQLQTKDLLLVEKDEKIEDFRHKFQEMSEATEKYQAEKFAFMEQLSNEKLELVEKLGKLERELEERDRKIKDLRKKSRDAQDGLLGASLEMEKIREETSKTAMQLQEANQEIDQLKQELEQLHQIIDQTPEQRKELSMIRKISDESTKPGMMKKYKEKIASLELQLKEWQKMGAQTGVQAPTETPEDLFERETGTYHNISTLITHFKFQMASVNRSIRIILPEASFIEDYGLKESMLALPQIVLKNIACNIDKSRDSAIIKELQEHNFKITDYKDSQLFALAIDNTCAAIAVFNADTQVLTGIFSRNLELVKLLSQSIMTPFIKGTKLN